MLDFSQHLRVDGQVLTRGGAGYEEARSGRIFSGRVAERYPDAICIASCEEDVQSCVEFAIERGITISVRSGGHNWFSCSLRDGGLLVDVGNLRSVEIDASKKLAVVGPGLPGSELARQLAPLGLFFPTGHCASTPIGGFLLGGGFGLGQERFGMSSSSIVAVTVVTPQGDIVRAEEGSEYFWLAKGGYTAMRGIVVSFTLRLFDAPACILSTSISYPAGLYARLCEELYNAKQAHENSKEVETTVISLRSPEPLAILSLTAWSDSDVAARSALAPFLSLHDNIKGASAPSTPPVLSPTTPLEILEGASGAYPPGKRYSTESIFINHTCPHEPLPDLSRDALALAGSAFSASSLLGECDGSFMLTIPMSHEMEVVHGPFGRAPSLLVLLYCIYEDAGIDAAADAEVQQIISSWKALAPRSQPGCDSGAVGAEAFQGRVTSQDQHGTTEGTVVARPGVTEGTVVTRPGVTEGTVVARPGVTERTVVARPGVTEGTVVARPGVTEGTTVQGGGLESVFGDKWQNLKDVASRLDPAGIFAGFTVPVPVNDISNP